jgi:hypothetical protein
MSSQNRYRLKRVEYLTVLLLAAIAIAVLLPRCEQNHAQDTTAATPPPNR